MAVLCVVAPDSPDLQRALREKLRIILYYMVGIIERGGKGKQVIGCVELLDYGLFL